MILLVLLMLLDDPFRQVSLVLPRNLLLLPPQPLEVVVGLLLHVPALIVQARLRLLLPED